MAEAALSSAKSLISSEGSLVKYAGAGAALAGLTAAGLNATDYPWAVNSESFAKKAEPGAKEKPGNIIKKLSTLIEGDIGRAIGKYLRE